MKSKRSINQIILLLAYILLILVMFVLPTYSVEGYSMARNTTSHLGAQHAPNAWVMNGVFILLGTVYALRGAEVFRFFPFHRVVLILFGLAIVATGFFQHRPIVEGIPYGILEDRLHSFFATVVGFFFTLFSISLAWIESTWRKRVEALAMGILAVALSLLIFTIPDYAGVWQRVMFISSFGWLICLFNRWG